MHAAAIIVAAGKGARLRSFTRAVPKAFLKLGAHPLVYYSIKAFEDFSGVQCIVVVTHRQYVARTRRLIQKYRFKKVIAVVKGSYARALSVRAGVRALRVPQGYVLVHDAARPFVPREMLKRLIKAVARSNACVIPAIPASSTLKYARGGVVRKTMPRNDIYEAQTPQAVRYDVLRRAYEQFDEAKIASATDEAMLAEWLGMTVRVVAGDERTIKITVPRDYALAKILLKEKH